MARTSASSGTVESMGTGFPPTMNMYASGRMPQEAAASDMAIPAFTSNRRPPMLIVDMRAGRTDMVNGSIAGLAWTDGLPYSTFI